MKAGWIPKPDDLNGNLAWLTEEAGEVLQAIGKIYRHGYGTRWPPVTGPSNAETLLSELGDLKAAILAVEGCLRAQAG